MQNSLKSFRLTRLRKIAFFAIIWRSGLAGSWLLLGGGALVAQQRLVWHAPAEVLPLPPGNRFADSASLWQHLEQVVQGLQENGRIEASIDSLRRQDTLWQVWLHAGPRYRWAGLRNGNVPAEWWRRAGLGRVVVPNGRSSLRTPQSTRAKVLAEAANRGYPLAVVGLDSFELEDNAVRAQVLLRPGPLIVYDTLHLLGEKVLSPLFLANFLGLKVGRPYQQRQVEAISNRLRELPFVQLMASPSLQISGQRAQLELDLRRRQASRFDFIIGVLPNSRQFGRLVVTATLEGELQNQFGLGERLYLRFEQLRPQTPRLDLQAQFPYLLGSPIGGTFQFNLYRRDTTFLDTELDLGAQYLLGGSNFFKLFLNRRSSRLLGFNAVELLQQQRLPDQLDVTQLAYGAEFNQAQLDYRFNPRKGYQLSLKASLGTKSIRPNNRLLEIGLGPLYDTLVLRSTQYRLQGQLSWYLPWRRRGVVKLAGQGAALLGNQPLYRNELYRLGGNRLLRGFDEEFLLVGRYVVATGEYRLLLGQNSYLYTFLDAGWLHDPLAAADSAFRATGFGAGLTFETRPGLFGLSLAFGQRQGEAIDWTAPKVHFGFVSLF